MKTIIAGSRDITDFAAVEDAFLSCPWDVSEIVSGGARGVDTLAENLADLYRIPKTVFPADWAKYKKAAGPLRNEQMARYADALIAVWDGRSPGTRNMIKTASLLKLKVHIHHASNN